jgi:hypothetical protein
MTKEKPKSASALARKWRQAKRLFVKQREAAERRAKACKKEE